MANHITGLFESHFKVCEASSDVDGKYVIGKIKGTFFVPNGKSRNERFYPSELWERVLSNESVLERIRDRRMFGTISHNQEIDDDAFLQGKFSHIVIKLDPKTGIGEALILNTPAGNILNTVVRAGSKIFVSSRARGDFAGTHKGLPRVNPDTYCLETFDIVLSPGFKEASPSLQESLNKKAKSYQEIREYLKRGNDMKKKPISTSNTTNNTNEDLIPEDTDLNEGNLLERYQALGTPEELEEVLLRAEEGLLEAEAKKVEEDLLHEELGTSDEIAEVFSRVEDFIARNGSFDVAEEALERSSQFFEEFGSPSEIQEALELATAAMRKATKVLESQEYYYEDEYDNDTEDDFEDDSFEDNPFEESHQRYLKKGGETRKNVSESSPFDKPRIITIMEKFSR